MISPFYQEVGLFYKLNQEVWKCLSPWKEVSHLGVTWPRQIISVCLLHPIMKIAIYLHKRAYGSIPWINLLISDRGFNYRSIKTVTLGGRDGSVVKSTNYSSEGPEFKSQQPHGGSWPSIMRSDILFWYLKTVTVYLYIYIYIYIYLNYLYYYILII